MTHESPEHHAHAHHEESDVNVSAIVVFIIVLIVAAVVTQGGVYVLYRHFKQTVSSTGAAEFPLAADSMRRLPPEPRLQVDPRQDLVNLRRSEDEVLNSYGWVDRNAGVVRIPIDQAMKLIAEKGMPTR